MHTEWATTGHPAKSPAPLPRCQLARTGDRGQGPRHLGAQARPPPHHTPRPGLGHPPPAKSSAPLQCCQLAKGRAHWNRPPLAPGTYPGTSKAAAPTTPPPSLVSRPSALALDLALSGKGPRPVHPANWRRVLDVESRPSDTCDARGRSLEVSPPPSARRCRGTLMGRCVLHKSSQGSG